MVRIKKYDDKIDLRLPKELKVKAEQVLQHKYKKSVSEFLREKLEEIAKEEY